MKNNDNNAIKLAFEVLQDREKYFQNISEDNYPKSIIWGQIGLLCIFTFAYGLVMGSYNGVLQALVSGLKILILIFMTLLICFPSFYIVQLILGSKIVIRHLIIILLSGFVMTTTIMLAFAPIVLFFQLSGDNYHFLQLLHVFIFVFSGFFGMRVVLEALKNAFESTKVYPKIGLTVFRIWLVIFAFVGIQLSWNLRPFVGTKSMPFQIVRKSTQGNFYSTILGSLGHMMGISKEKEDTPNTIKSPDKKDADTSQPVKKDTKQLLDSLSKP
ncbi:hypothetical protein QQ020_19475 [Fulvivirgaceae bacterium BMA12]|uniref:Actin-binding WH2 domain-containing protein n=1 Tax=Agaribacillus aureus TaxID=3051825 RepID=A0ABT8L9B9_9BACT|nr:hypothetical protein [Fulvivirgaceae bacterium BMA12]